MHAFSRLMKNIINRSVSQRRIAETGESETVQDGDGERVSLRCQLILAENPPTVEQEQRCCVARPTKEPGVDTTTWH